jgi:hypothetical protein
MVDEREGYSDGLNMLHTAVVRPFPDEDNDGWLKQLEPADEVACTTIRHLCRRCPVCEGSTANDVAVRDLVQT